ncbi:hypothetical protein BJX96DRAFT_171990 [Aspergillus floccosus]
MKYSHTLAVAFTACMGFSPMVAGILGTACIGSLDAMSSLPGDFVENIRKQSCQAGCAPKFDHWDKYGKEAVLKPLAADGARYAGVPDAQDATFNFLDQVYQGVTEDCKDKLSQDAHLCEEPELLQPFLDCAKSKARGHAVSSLSILLPWAKEDACKKTTEYLHSSTLWDEDFPKNFKGYVEKCHEL